MNSIKVPNSLKIGLFVGLLALLGAGFYFRKYQSQKDAVVVAKADVRDEQITELQTVIAAKTDSIILISSERDDFIKLIIAQESQLKKNKPNDEKIIKTYQSLSDSAAHAMFLERYTKSGFFEKY
ncbi:hypothetical protein MCERE19_01092 [Spirosomataceae bacterium]